MTNPENVNLGGAKITMSIFWDCQSIDWGFQRWPDSKAFVHELSQNIRSGEDKWWNEVLEQARQGELSEDNYNWLHGFPSTCIRNAPLKFWYRYKNSCESPCTCPQSSNTDICEACLMEKQRRCRVK